MPCEPRFPRAIIAFSILVAGSVLAQEPDELIRKLTAGVWAYVDDDGRVVVSGSFLGVPPDSILLPEALAVRQAFDFCTDDPVLGCGEPGMPRAFTAGSPMTFAWSGDEPTIHYESMDVERSVQLNAGEPDVTVERSPNGYAVGRREADELVIETTRLDSRIVDLLGMPKSSAMTLEERYRVEDEDNETFLCVDLTMTDLLTFSEPYVWHFNFVQRPDRELLEYACVERPIQYTPGIVPEWGGAAIVIALTSKTMSLCCKVLDMTAICGSFVRHDTVGNQSYERRKPDANRLESC